MKFKLIELIIFSICFYFNLERIIIPQSFRSLFQHFLFINENIFVDLICRSKLEAL
jgi:hypothetical protein